MRSKWVLNFEFAGYWFGLFRPTNRRMATMKQTISPFQREAMLLELLQQFIEDKLSQGELLMQLRKKVLGFSQERYAALVGISRRTLSDIEQDKENSTLSTLNRAFYPLGLKLGVLPRQPHMLKTLLIQLADHGESNDHT
jgi:DNA-binding XRE family transcriptional regulator